MNRRALLSGLLCAAGGLVLPWEPRRVYSFLPPARTVAVRFFDRSGVPLATVERDADGVFGGIVDITGTACDFDMVDNYGHVSATGYVTDGMRTQPHGAVLYFNTEHWLSGSNLLILNPSAVGAGPGAPFWDGVGEMIRLRRPA